MSKSNSGMKDKELKDDAAVEQQPVHIQIGGSSPPSLPPPNPDGSIPSLNPQQVAWVNEQAAMSAAKMSATYVNNIMFGYSAGGSQARVTFAENVLNPYLPEPRVVLVMDWGAIEAFGKGFLEFYLAKKKQDMMNDILKKNEASAPMPSNSQRMDSEDKLQ
jgi:hypothetical protein